MAAGLRVLNLVKYFVPYGLYLLALRSRNRRKEPPLPHEALAANSGLRGRKAGRKCFILGNAPSVNLINLRQLKGEDVISVSSGYQHKFYRLISPIYHCVPQITYGAMTESDVVSWFTEMHEQIGTAQLFLNETEASLVTRYRLFNGRNVSYVSLRENVDQLTDRHLPDLTRPIPRVESVPVMAIMVAMYLGYREICLLGIDHDSWRTGEYNYAFDKCMHKDFSVANDGKVITSNYDTFASLGRLWRQYRFLKEVASENGISIVNCGVGGELDEFPRIPIEKIVSGSY